MAISSDFSDQFSPREDDDETLWEATAILKEKPNKYYVEWAGLDPNGKPWPPSWVPKRDCTTDLVHAFKARQKKEKGRKGSKKQSKSRNSTVSRSSETSKASTSAGPSGRTVRPKSVEPEQESISRTPVNPKKRRLSKPVISPSASELDDDPPPSPPRPSKKRKHNPPELIPEPAPRKRAQISPDSDSDASTAVAPKQNRSAKSAAASPRRKPTSTLQAHLDKLEDDLFLPTNSQQDDIDYYDLIPSFDLNGQEADPFDKQAIPSAQPKGKGKARSRTPPAPKRASKPSPVKKTVMVEIPSPKVHHRSDPVSYPQTQMSSVLSPRAQNMLNEFDADMPQSPSQRPDSHKTKSQPLFFGGVRRSPTLTLHLPRCTRTLL
ncbi:hypothetical protein FB45DRAFT_140539 [Roridomyces roridus]|uniref:Chromo domain-containing protein n=1 Tax=Roridomyces roridus TaxID=1738132 RepID=A0AAD7BID5_9AGAR|nr:hypothetical protein FB45DRAFT_140539 [Roridomyces roridus]